MFLCVSICCSGKSYLEGPIKIRWNTYFYSQIEPVRLCFKQHPILNRLNYGYPHLLPADAWMEFWELSFSISLNRLSWDVWGDVNPTRVGLTRFAVGFSFLHIGLGQRNKNNSDWTSEMLKVVDLYTLAESSLPESWLQRELLKRLLK